MHDRYEWTIGLGSDQLGYIMPISNFRVQCVADEFMPGACAQPLRRRRHRVPRRGRGHDVQGDHRGPGRARGQDPHSPCSAITASCKYGQALGEANGHYEETNSASWDLAPTMLDAVGVLTGDTTRRR